MHPNDWCQEHECLKISCIQQGFHLSRRGHAGEAEPPPADGRKPIAHFYESIEGWFDFEELYREAVKRMPGASQEFLDRVQVTCLRTLATTLERDEKPPSGELSANLLRNVADDLLSRRGHAGEAAPPPASARECALMVEVGVYKGRSFFFLAVEAFNSGKPIHVIAVDKFDWPSTGARDFSRMRAAHGLTQSVSMVEATSIQASRQFDDESLDFVFIDADHEYESVKADIAAWWPKVKPGGILAGHDFCDEFPGVRQAVLEHCLLHNLPPQGVIIPPRSWWIDKR